MIQYANSMKLHDFALIPREAMNELTTRQVIHSGQMTVSRLYLKPGAVVPLHHHVNEQLSIVLSGRLRLLLGEDEHLIEAGEAAEFSTWTPHWFGAADGPVELIMIFGPDGERSHLH